MNHLLQNLEKGQLCDVLRAMTLAAKIMQKLMFDTCAHLASDESL